MYKKFEVVPSLYIPGKDITVLHVEFLEEALEAVGVLRDLTAIIAMKGISILKIHFTGLYATIFLDTTGKSPKEVEETAEALIKGVKFIKKVDIQIPEVKGFAIDKTVIPTFFNERAIILRESAFKSIIEGIFKSLKVVPQTVLYIIGREMGENFFKRHVETMGVMDKRSYALIAEQIFRGIGFGIPENVKMDLEGGEVEYIVYDCVECRINLEAGRRVKSSLIRGLIEGYYSKLLNREVECIEEECITQGNNKCRMILRGV